MKKQRASCCGERKAARRSTDTSDYELVLGPGTAIHDSHFSVLLTQIDQSDTIPHSSAGLISDQPE
eukprot:SAG25_NODE_12899_length_274_cov_0.571429_2_plen_65_part_01